MPSCRISTACIIVLASITGACADANLTGLDVSRQPAHSVSIAATAWTASGPGTVTVVSDGTAGDAVMTYNLADDFSFNTWDFGTIADQTATVTLPWSWVGTHLTLDSLAEVQLQAVVNGAVVATLVPVQRVASNFARSGTYTFTVSAGDTYGFRLGGASNGTLDSTALLEGTFTVGEPEGPVDPATKDDCKNGGWMAYGFQNQGQCILFVATGQDSR